MDLASLANLTVIAIVNYEFVTMIPQISSKIYFMTS